MIKEIQPVDPLTDPWGYLAQQEREYHDQHDPCAPMVTVQKSEDPQFWWIYQNGICTHGPFLSREDAEQVLKNG